MPGYFPNTVQDLIRKHYSATMAKDRSLEKPALCPVTISSKSVHNQIWKQYSVTIYMDRSSVKAVLKPVLCPVTISSESVHNPGLYPDPKFSRGSLGGSGACSPGKFFLSLEHLRYVLVASGTYV